MYVAGIPMKPVASPRPKTPSHVPDSGSGFIVMSVVILLLAVIGKKLGFLKGRPDW